MWIRDSFLNASQLGIGKLVIHGHTPTREPDRRTSAWGSTPGPIWAARSPPFAFTAVISPSSTTKNSEISRPAEAGCQGRQRLGCQSARNADLRPASKYLTPKHTGRRRAGRIRTRNRGSRPAAYQDHDERSIRGIRRSERLVSPGFGAIVPLRSAIDRRCRSGMATSRRLTG